MIRLLLTGMSAQQAWSRDGARIYSAGEDRWLRVSVLDANGDWGAYPFDPQSPKGPASG